MPAHVRLKIPVAPIRGSAPGTGKAGVRTDMENWLPVPPGIQATGPVLLRAPIPSRQFPGVYSNDQKGCSDFTVFRSGTPKPFSVALLTTSLDSLPPPRSKGCLPGATCHSEHCPDLSLLLDTTSVPLFTKTCRMASVSGLVPRLGPCRSQCRLAGKTV